MKADLRLFSRTASCDGKESFLTRGLAERVAGRMARRHKGMRAHAYQCRGCGCYHVGSTIGKAA
jgi:hypothetical protein